MGKQIQQFATVQSNLTAAIGSEETEKLLSKSMFLISTGSNDILRHFLTISGLRKEEFIKILGDAYDEHLKARFFLSFLMITVHNIVLPTNHIRIIMRFIMIHMIRFSFLFLSHDIKASSLWSDATKSRTSRC